MKFAWIHVEKAQYPVGALCRAVGVSRPGYYAWRERAPSARSQKDAQLLVQITAVFRRSRGTYGVPRIHAELREMGIRTSRRRIARIMLEAGLTASDRPRRPRGRSSRLNPLAENLVKRDFTADAPNCVWTGDITYISTAEGFLFLAVLLDVFSRRVVGWAAAPHQRTELVLDALAGALAHRQPLPGAVHHSDQGSQYGAHRYQRALRDAGFRCSMSRRGNCLDNAVTESFFAALKRELVDRKRWLHQDEAHAAIKDYIEHFYNPIRRHSALGNISPIEFERRHRHQEAKAA